jgi:hypothetical protein
MYLTSSPGLREDQRRIQALSPTCLRAVPQSPFPYDRYSSPRTFPAFGNMTSPPLLLDLEIPHTSELTTCRLTIYATIASQSHTSSCVSLTFLPGSATFCSPSPTAIRLAFTNRLREVEGRSASYTAT